jgi:serine protease Do
MRRSIPGFLLLAALPFASAATAQRAADRPAMDAAAVSSALESASRTVAPAVVQIFATSYAPGDAVHGEDADLVSTQRASGSGVIVDPEGYIVTNAHVVQGAHRLRVELHTPASSASILASRSRVVGGRVIGVDLETDLAVIRVDERGLPHLSFGDSDELSVGQLVLAFGSPLGLQNSVSLGIVSAVARQLEPESPMIYVQTDAAINPGSSGGPLVDVRGRVVGINTGIASRTGGHEGVGFAAPSNIVRTVFEQIKARGRVRRGDIGVRAQTITPVLAQGLGLPRERGVVLADVLPGSPAARAGLQQGDLVLALDGKPMDNGRQLQVNLYRRFVGDVVSLAIMRGGESRAVAVTIEERPDPFAGSGVAPDPRQNVVPRLGILGITLDRRIAEMVPVLRVTSGVVVASTTPGALDGRAGGLAAGDVIYAVNGTRVQELSELRARVGDLKPGDPVVLQIERRGELMYVAFTAE